MNTRFINIRIIVPALCVFFFAANVDARRPARTECTLSKKDRAKALSQIRKTYPQVKRLAKERGCFCNFATEDCSLVDVRFAPVEIPIPKAKISFKLNVETSVWLKVPKDVVIGGDEPMKVDFAATADSIRELEATKLLFGDDPIVCEAKGRERSIRFTCATSNPAGQVGGGHPGAGARVVSIVVNSGKAPEVWMMAGPLDVISKADHWRWRSAARRPKVEAFIESHPDATVVIRKREVELVSKSGERVFVRFDK